MKRGKTKDQKRREKALNEVKALLALKPPTKFICHRCGKEFEKQGTNVADFSFVFKTGIIREGIGCGVEYRMEPLCYDCSTGLIAALEIFGYTIEHKTWG